MIAPGRRPELSALRELVELLRGRSVVVLAGAGCSTESGIPDYRGPRGSLRRGPPMGYREFVRSAEGRRRYWARSAVGWPRVSVTHPNPAHRALARLEEAGVVRGIITQNVDGLHHAAGSRRVVEHHGTLGRVVCLACGTRESREAFQDRISRHNPGWLDGELVHRVRTAPDGDAELPDEAVARFRVPGCSGCGGAVKPDVVFFGETVPPDTVAEAWRLYGEGNTLLVVGSSLHVYSGRRFTIRAREDGLPVGIVNLGPTRADEQAAARVEGRLGRVLPRVAHALLGATTEEEEGKG